MKILYDHQAFTCQNFGGVSRYFYELIRHLADYEGIDIRLSLKYSNNSYLDGIHSEHKAFLPSIHFRGKVRIQNFFNQRASAKAVLKNDYNVFHPTYFDPYFLEILNNKPYIITVYDMINEFFPSQFINSMKITEFKKNVIHNAWRIIAISHNTKKDIIRLHNINPDDIHVIHLGCSLLDLQAAYINVPERYMLFIGERKGYKNFDRFITSIAELLRKDDTLYLVAAGSSSFSKRELSLFDELKIKDNIVHFPIGSDSQLAAVYRGALAFIFPSLYEGFGIPVLESFACECPVILSNSSSFPEVAGDAGCYFDPESSESICRAVENVIYDNDMRTTMIAKGKEQLKKFSWVKTAEQTLSVYKKVIQK